MVVKRDLDALAGREHDLVVVGGGIYGAAAAWDATLRGLRVALVERDDFGSGTSFNSSKTIHGGLRYLQHADLRRMRESIRERAILMRIAPHLVRPLPFLVPTYRDFTRSRMALGVALALNDLVSIDDRSVPRGRLVSREECVRLAPGIDTRGLTGGAVWYDAHMHDSDRMTLSFVLSAAEAGAAVANHARVTGFLSSGGVRVRDELGGNELDVRAKIVLNACGPWVDDLLKLLDGEERPPLFLHSKAMNLVTRPLSLPTEQVAIGVTSRKGHRDADAVVGKGWRFLTLIPWRNVSIVGTRHMPHRGGANNVDAAEEEIRGFLDEVNDAYPGAELRREDVRLVHRGLLPMARDAPPSDSVTLQKHYAIHENGRGVITMVGVKYTTARGVAEKAVDRVVRQLGRARALGRTATTPLWGGDIEGSPASHLESRYGSQSKRIRGLADENPEWAALVVEGAPVLKAEVIQAVREEMAETLASVVIRRTGLGSAGRPGRAALDACATLVAKERGWSAARSQKEIEDVETFYERRT